MNTLMVFGGVGFIGAMLNMADWLMRFRVKHFLMFIATAIIVKMVYGMINKEAKDPFNTHRIARPLFYAGMGILGAALVMRNYGLGGYDYLLYLDIPVQITALIASFSKNPTQVGSSAEVID